MQLIYKLLFTISLSFCTFLSAQSQGVWADVNMAQVAPGRTLDKGYSISDYRTVSLDLPALRGVLRDAPMEFTTEGRNAPLTVEFPMPNGEMEAFAIVESPIMEPGLSAKYPSIKTFSGRSLTNPANRIRLDYNNVNFNAIFITTEGTILITPFADDLNDYYIVHRVKDVVYPHDHVGFTCQVSDHGAQLTPAEMDTKVAPTNTRMLESVDLQTYRYAVATTGEYYNQFGGNDILIMNNIANVTNQMNAVYEIEVAVRLVLIEETDNVFYDDPSMDPYDNGPGGDLSNMLSANQTTMSNPGIIGLDNFDIGQVFGTNGGGLASLASVCVDNQKARSASANNGFQIFYLTVAHETGHQFNATHTFNACGGNNENAPTGYEPGSGSTIMGYSGAGGCGNNYIQGEADAYFHINSLERMKAYTRTGDGAGCAVTVSVDNNTPEVTIPIEGGFNIPISTPFELTAEATDQEGDEMTYCWEQYDLGPFSQLGNPIGTAPLFRSFLPVMSPTRVFPRIEDVVTNTSDIREVLPTITRPLTFRCTVRDNNSDGGGYDFEEIAFNSTASAGPFLVSSPNAGTENWEVGDYVEVTWDVANTDNEVVNCKTVNIKLSMDGGFTYPITLKSDALNDGSTFVNVPDAVTNQARVRVEAADNIFFDISNENFEISPAANAGFTVSTEPCTLPIVCLPDIVDIVIETGDILDFENEITFNVDGGLPTGATASFSNETVLPGVQTILTIDLTDVTEEGVFSVNISGEADGADTEVRTIDLNLVYTDFSGLSPLTPNEAGTSVIPTFTWTDIAHADNYEMQLSTSPTFDNVIFSNIGEENSVVSGVALELGTQYFWRVRAINECGEFEFTTPNAFLTEALVCTSLTNDTDVNIPAIGNPSVSSVISIGDSGEINDLNVTQIQGQHNQLRDLNFTLMGPDGTSITFLEGGTCNATSFDFGFDDESTETFACPPVAGEIYDTDAMNMLSAFDGKEVNGDWTLTVNKVDDFFQQAGVLSSWSLEYCGTFPAANPFVDVNDLTCVPILGSRAITDGVLNIDDDDNFPGQLIFTLVTIPQNGNLLFNGTPLAIGDTFTQQNLNDFDVYYENTNADVLTDDFAFTVIDGNGGFLGTQTFNMEIVEEGDCITNTVELNPDTDIILYPNPANEILFVDFKQPIVGQMTADIIDVQGRVVASHQFENVAGKININTADLVAGVYFISFQTVDNVFTKKVTINK